MRISLRPVTCVHTFIKKRLGPMVVPLRILPSQADDMAAVCAIGATALRQVSEAIGNAELTIKRERIRDTVLTIVPEPRASNLCRLIFGLSVVGSRNAKTIADTIEGVSITLKADYANEDRFTNWGEVSGPLLAILQCESVYLAAKAIDVAYDFERILTDCRIITSIRPIYNDVRTRIVGNTIVQTLRLEYVNSAGSRASTSVALDMSDVKKLRNVCEWAVAKAAVARQDLEEGKQTEIIMTGEEAEA